MVDSSGRRPVSWLDLSRNQQTTAVFRFPMRSKVGWVPAAKMRKRRLVFYRPISVQSSLIAVPSIAPLIARD